MDGTQQAKAAVEACLSWYERALRYTEQGIDALQRHLTLLGSAERTVRERALDLEAQRLEPDDPRLFESSTVLKLCAEQETNSRRTLGELLLNREGGGQERNAS